MSNTLRPYVAKLSEDEEAFKNELLESFDAFNDDGDGSRLVQIAIATVAQIVASGTQDSVPDEDIFEFFNTSFRENFHTRRAQLRGVTQ